MAHSRRAKRDRGEGRTILFFLHDFSYLRNFTESLRLLRRRGYRIVLALPEAAAQNGGGEERAIVRRNTVELVYVPKRRDDAWTPVLDWLRPARMYAHFQQPRYAGSAFLRARAERWVDERAREIVEYPPFRRRQRLLRRLLAALDAAVPPWQGAVDFIRSVNPDVVLVSPLLFPNTYYQNDYAKAAQSLGLPLGVPVFSWDNLTNKGTLQVLPDRLFVWNETQVCEAVDLHGMPRGRIVATGGMRFAQFFDQAPRNDRESYFAELGLDPQRPLVTYLGSSPAIAPDEPQFARRWLASLRASPDPRLAGCNVLFRPHPSNAAAWTEAGFEGLGPFAFSSLRRSNVDGVIDDVLHSVAVVGVNTTAMLEAAALDRPLFTVLDPEVRDGQQGTLHFHYLTEVAGGLVTVAVDMAEHGRQLSEVLDGNTAYLEKSRAFTAAFLRPPERDRSPLEVFVEAIEAFAASPPARFRPRPWRAPLRLLVRGLRPLLAGLDGRRGEASAR